MRKEQQGKGKKWWMDIIYEDEHILLVNKLIGMIVHPNQSNQKDSLLHHVREYLRKTGAWKAGAPDAFRPIPCNRLDRFTGGIVILAKIWEAMREMNRGLQKHIIEKKYYCIVVGQPRPPSGRMHQLRAKFANAGTPILGDMTYGDKKENYHRHQEYQLLYAYEIIFHFPSDFQTLSYLDGKRLSVKRVPFLRDYMSDIRKEYYEPKLREVRSLHKMEFLLCPVCGNKTRNKIRDDTILINYPVYCPKCKQETLINVKQLEVSAVKEPDAQTQSR